MAKRIAWLSDIHLELAEAPAQEALWQALDAAQVDALLLGGDLHTAQGIEATLLNFAERLQKPIYFVLGNHDFHYGSIGDLRWDVELMGIQEPLLTYLSVADPIALTPQVGLVGHDGWGDARVGDLANVVPLQDDVLIRELSSLGQEQLLAHLRDLGAEAADHIRHVLPRAMDHYPHVYLLTHVPPFLEACWYDGKPDDRGYAPRFVNGAMGEVIRQTMLAYPDRRLTILAGHTHAACTVQITDNIEVLVAGAVEGSPQIARILELDA